MTTNVSGSVFISPAIPVARPVTNARAITGASGADIASPVSRGSGALASPALIGGQPLGGASAPSATSPRGSLLNLVC